LLKPINVAIVLPCTWDFLPIQFFESWIKMEKPKHSVIVPKRGRIDDLRNSAVQSILDCKSFSHILFLDVDHSHHPETIKKLLSHNKRIVSGLSFRRTEPYDPIMFKLDKNKFENIIEWEDGELLEADAVGAASLLIDIDVLEQMKSPWFEMNYPFGRGVISEDLSFCLKAKELGYKIYCDTSCTNSHLGNLNVNKETWIRYNKLD